MAVETSTVKSMVSLRTARRRSPNLAGAIYGTIIATVVVAGLGESASVSAARALGVLLGTAAIFWAAHVYAYLLANRIQEHRRTERDHVRGVMLREWPLFQSSFPLAVPLALGWLGILGRGTALGLATLVGVLTLVALGIGFARREGYGVAGIVGAASTNAVVGLLIIGLKLAVR